MLSKNAEKNTIVSQGVALIEGERYRQIDELGYTPSLDKELYKEGVLLNVADAYIQAAQALMLHGKRYEDKNPPSKYPWDYRVWKESPTVEDYLARAGACIAAEIDRAYV